MELLRKQTESFLRTQLYLPKVFHVNQTHMNIILYNADESINSVDCSSNCQCA